jgi:DNA-binding NarL/FixJ family response regulator
MKDLRVYLVDDHTILREGLRLILSQASGVEIVGEQGDGRIAMEEIDQLKPDLVVLDISLPSLSGVEIARQIRKYHPSMKILVLSRHDNQEYVEQLLKYGVQGYILKEEAGSDLLKALDVIRKGENYLSPRITKHLVTGMERKKSANDPFEILTNREREVLKLVAEGKSNEKIAQALWISAKTVKVHRANIMRKLDIHKVADLVKYAIKAGIIEA